MVDLETHRAAGLLGGRRRTGVRGVAGAAARSLVAARLELLELQLESVRALALLVREGLKMLDLLELPRAHVDEEVLLHVGCGLHVGEERGARALALLGILGRDILLRYHDIGELLPPLSLRE